MADRNPLSRSVRQQAAEQIDVVGRAFDDRAGGANSRALFRARVAEVDDLATHTDDDAGAGACEAVARAVVAVERLQAEHDDVGASDVALTRARALLIEAGALLETLAHVNPHGLRIQAARDAALLRAKNDARES